MSVTVYFESGIHAEIVAQFSNEELYLACLPVLEQIADSQGMTVTESVQEEE